MRYRMMLWLMAAGVMVVGVARAEAQPSAVAQPVEAGASATPAPASGDQNLDAADAGDTGNTGDAADAGAVREGDTAASSNAEAGDTGTGRQATLRVVVTGVEGAAHVRLEEDGAWQAAKAGMEVGIGAAFRTGLRGAVRLAIPPGQTITLGRLSTMSVLDAIEREAGKYKTDVGLKYGRVRYEVEAASGEHRSTIHSPAATLAITGTETVFEDRADAMPVTVLVADGTAAFRKRKGSQVLVGKKSRTARMSAQDKSPSETARREGRLNPRGDFAGQTETELGILAAQPLIGGDLLRARGVAGFQQAARRPVLDRGMLDGPIEPPPNGGGFPDLDPSEFRGVAFLTTWNGTGDRGSNVDLSVMSPADEALLTGANRTVPSGGQHLGDFVATSSTDFSGFEAAIWFGQNFPAGLFDVILDLKNLPSSLMSDPVAFEMTVFSVDSERGIIETGPFNGTLSPESPRQVFPIDTRELHGGYNVESLR